MSFHCLGPVHLHWVKKLSLPTQGLRCVSRSLPSVIIWLTSGTRTRSLHGLCESTTKQGYGCSRSGRPCQSLSKSFPVNTEVITKCDRVFSPALKDILTLGFSLWQKCIAYIFHVLGLRLNKTNNFYCFVRVIVKRNWLFCLNWPERGGEEHRGSSTCLAGAEDQPRHHHGLCVTSAIACKRQISLIITVKIPLLWRPCQKGTKEPQGSVEHTWRTSRTAKDPSQLKGTKRDIEKLPPSPVHWRGWFQCP